MKTILRGILAVVVGFIVGSCVNMSLVLLGPHVIPPPHGVNVGDMESVRAAIHLFEAKHFVFPFIAHALGTFAGSVVAFLLAASSRPAFAVVIGVLNLAGGIAAAFMIPAPMWFLVLDLLVAYLPMAWLGILVGKKITK
ncbi:MAG: hypothetical protein SFY80_08725 [Verrucomicrobiota bacterium]|nr:hypothetical protein [Verrucomicrobiota bacterium]